MNWVWAGLKRVNATVIAVLCLHLFIYFTVLTCVVRLRQSTS
jgi:hypothetical protein